MRYSLRIQMDSDSFDEHPGFELGRILRQEAARVERIARTPQILAKSIETGGSAEASGVKIHVADQVIIDAAGVTVGHRLIEP